MGAGKRLILLDNAHDARQVRVLIPPPPCGVIVTSRRYIAIDGVEQIRLDVLSEPDAAALATSIAKLTDSEAAALTKACGHFALAIKLAAHTIANNPAIPAPDHIARLKDDRLAFLDHCEATDPDGLPFIRRAFETSLAQLPPEL